MWNEFLLFVSAFGVVFALGFQSLNVNAGHYRLAFGTSLLIGTFNLFLYKLAPNANSATEIAAFLIGGPFGIVCSMWAHKRLKEWMKVREEGRALMKAQAGFARAFAAARPRHCDELPGGMAECPEPAGRFDGGRFK